MGTYLRWFTELSRDEIDALETRSAASPEGRIAQRALARDITARTHGEVAADAAIAESAARFSTETVADGPALAALYGASGEFTFPADADVIAILADGGLVTSRGEARRLIQGGGVSINGERVTDIALIPSPIDGEWLDVRIGKRRREIGRRVG